MPGGAFNTAALIAELGLKPVGQDEMRVLGGIQPVLVAGDLSALTPPHVPASAIFGGNLVGAVAELATIQLQSLAPGGCFIEWLAIRSAQLTMLRLRQVSAGALAALPPAAIVSRDTPVSVVTQGPLASIGGAAAPLEDSNGPRHLGIFIPPGAFFTLQSLVPDVPMEISMLVREVPAAPAL